jgi:hypothetical protein
MAVLAGIAYLTKMAQSKKEEVGKVDELYRVVLKRLQDQVSVKPQGCRSPV